MSTFISGIVTQLQSAVDTIDAAGEYYVSQSEIEELRETLSGLITDLEGEPMKGTPHRVFGESWGGGYLGHHTSIAEQHVQDARARVISGLGDFREAVVNAERLAVEADGDVADRWRALAGAPLIVDTATMNEGSSSLSQPDLSDSSTH